MMDQDDFASHAFKTKTILLCFRDRKHDLGPGIHGSLNWWVLVVTIQMYSTVDPSTLALLIVGCPCQLLNQPSRLVAVTLKHHLSVDATTGWMPRLPKTSDPSEVET